MIVKSWKPRNEWSLILIDKGKEPSHGLITPDNIDKETPSTGVVISVGTKVVDLKKGDKVVFPQYAGERMEDQETKEKYVFLHEEDILANK